MAAAFLRAHLLLGGLSGKSFVAHLLGQRHALHVHRQGHGQRVGYLQVAVPGLGVVYHAGAHAVGHGVVALGARGDVAVAAVGGEEPLHLIGGGGAHLGVGEVDHVGVPVGVSVLAQQRGVARHGHHIGIALYIGQVDALGQCCLHVGAFLRRRGGPFAQIHLGSLAVVVVVVAAVVQKPSRAFIVVLVYQVYHVLVLLGKVPALDVVGRGGVEGSHGAAHLNVGIFLLHRLAYHEVALLEDRRDDVLVAYADGLQTEGGGMAGVGAHLGPRARGGVAVGPFYQVEYLLAVGRHVGHRYAALLSAPSVGVVAGVLAGHAGGQHGQGLSADVLAELEVLIESQSAGLVVVPDVEVGLAVLQRSHGVVPVVDVVDAVAVAHAAARETDEFRLQVGDGLCQVFAQTVFTAFEGVLREEAYQVYRGGALLLRCHQQAGMGGAFLRGQGGGILAPGAAFHLHLHLCQRFRLALGGEGYHQRFLFAVGAAGVEAQMVDGTGLHHHAVPTLVGDGAVGEQGVVGVVLAQRLLGAGGDGAFRTPGRGGGPLLAVLAAVFEVAVLHHLGVEAAVGGIADVLEEHADEPVAYRLLLLLVHHQLHLCHAQVLVALGIVGHALLVELGVAAQQLVIGEQVNQFALGDVEYLAGKPLAAHGGRVVAPGHLADGAGGVGCEGAEVFRGGEIAFLVAALEEDVVAAVFALKHDGAQAGLRGHAGIVLWAPGDEVLAVGGGETGRHAVHLPHGAPGAVGGVHHIGGVHAFLAAPPAVVGGAQLSYLLPQAVEVHVGGVQALCGVGRVDENLACHVVASVFLFGFQLLCGGCRSGHGHEEEGTHFQVVFYRCHHDGSF